jgi:O-antigen/teichoic acid export membrane protein
MAKVKRNIKEVKKAVVHFRDYWTTQNYVVLLIAIGFLIVGFILMSFGPWDNKISLSVAPVVLLIGYVILIPLSIFFKMPKWFKKENNVSGKDQV